MHSFFACVKLPVSIYHVFFRIMSLKFMCYFLKVILFEEDKYSDKNEVIDHNTM